jgi:RepB DNA-primase from phage plasmid
MMPALSKGAVDFVHREYAPGDWVGVFVKSCASGRIRQRVCAVEQVAEARFQAWLRAENAAGANVYISVNAVRPGQHARTRHVIAHIRHVFLDVDRDLPHVLTAVRRGSDLPPPSCVIHTSPTRGHVLWKVTGFTPAVAEALQRHLAHELRTDPAATVSSQLTRLPGFLNYKYQPPARIRAAQADTDRVYAPADFPRPLPATSDVRAHAAPPVRACGHVERARRYMRQVRPAVAGQHGDVHTFRVCCRLVRGFALNDEDALAVLVGWNQRCVPPWSERELRAKLQHARRYGREPIGGVVGPSWWD